jgi:hypothetical protein
MGRYSAPWLITALLVSILLSIAGYALFAAVRPTPVPTVSAGDFVVRVDARKAGWQSAGIAVEAGVPVRVAVIGGTWTHFRGEAPSNAGAGGGYICAEAMPAAGCIEPVPGFPQGGLVGRIGGRTFAVGEGTSLVAPAGGQVELRINDADEGLYDNDGALTVRVTVGP